MISVGQLTGRTLTALWRRRFAVLALLLAWLALDGILLGYLIAYHPALFYSLLSVPLSLADPAWLRSDWAQGLLHLSQDYLRDAIRAVFVVLLLRTLLAPPAGGGKRARSGLIVPILLVLGFEIAWTTVLSPVDLGVVLGGTRAVSGGAADVQMRGFVSAAAKGLAFGCYALAMSKLCFVYPNAILRRALRPGLSWRQTEGLGARLFLLFVAIAILFYVLHTLLLVVVLQNEAVIQSPHLILLTNLVLQSVREIPAAIATLAVIAVAYVAATGHAAAAIPGAGRTSGQLAAAFD